MKRIIIALAAAAVAVVALFIGYGIAEETYLPSYIYLNIGDEFSYAGGLLTLETENDPAAEAASRSGGSYSAKLCLFGVVPLKTVMVTATEDVELVPGGMPFGVKMFTSGVIVVGMGDVEGRNGRSCPAADAGMEVGDIILTANGHTVTGNDSLLGIVNDSGGDTVHIVYMRDGVSRTAHVKPVLSADGSSLRIGMWVRDSSAGIGTVTYYNPASGLMGGLGHGITDVDTGTVLPVSSGEIARVAVTGVTKGNVGSPGELKGMFIPSAPVADLIYNCEAGIFADVWNEGFFDNTPLPVAYKQDVKTGSALILCTVEGSAPQYYEIEIESCRISDSKPTKNLVIHVTDSRLLEATGGIVQGMSGSPIVQNGCIIGAVTHVFVNDPTRGYGIFIENMLFNERYAESEQKAG